LTDQEYDFVFERRQASCVKLIHGRDNGDARETVPSASSEDERGTKNAMGPFCGRRATSRP
jgi:hypothetical protein